MDVGSVPANPPSPYLRTRPRSSRTPNAKPLAVAAWLDDWGAAYSSKLTAQS
ncbi:hypothetical protein HBA53_20790 [Rhodococcus pyridinivorans]|uniref:hypothetical protein n=1 Tax=Rhodococcus TaxID=1827 RepID=UPI001C30074D|nr:MULTISPECIES: hypothetical protein [Rhodococcus]MBX4169097.1 hypothetical protein [Rhodococcus sp. DMU2021]QXF83161.1 hypothetical protein HBA53_20790 [Rhodococcus pyridinivorans]